MLTFAGHSLGIAVLPRMLFAVSVPWRLPGLLPPHLPCCEHQKQSQTSPGCPPKPLSCSGNKLPHIPVTQAENPGPLLIKPGSLDSVALATCTFFPILLFGLGPRLLYPAIMGPDSWDVYGVR